MKDDDDKVLPGETSKDDDPVNVNPDDAGNSTTVDPTPPEPPKGDDKSKDEVNTQAAIQKHAELRQQEREARLEAEKKLQEAEEEKKNLLGQIEANKKSNLDNSVKSRIEKSNLPAGLQARILKDPVKWVLSNVDGAPQDLTNLDEVSKVVSESLNVVVKEWETELGVTNSPIATFVDSDNSSIQTPGKTISVDDLKKMSPYEIQALPKEVREKLLSAGSKVEI